MMMKIQMDPIKWSAWIRRETNIIRSYRTNLQTSRRKRICRKVNIIMKPCSRNHIIICISFIKILILMISSSVTRILKVSRS